MEKSEGQEWIMEMWKAKENAMDEFKFNVETTVIGISDNIKRICILSENRLVKIQNAAILLSRSKLY